MTAQPLVLTLQSTPATRTPGDLGRFEYGAQLRLVGGPVVVANDPLLRMYGASTRSLSGVSDTAALHREEFDPGRWVTLEIEYDEDGDSVVGIWDEEGVRRAGALAYSEDCPIIAALDHGLELRGLVLREHVSASTHERELIDVLVFAPGFVNVEVPADLAIERPARARPKRLVLLADGRGELGFWDPSGDAGPASPDELPLSPALADELMRLRARYRALTDGEAPDDGFEELELGWIRENLQHRTTILWRRACVELGHRFAVGFQGPGMARPIWSPQELADDDGEDPSDLFS